MTKPIIRIHNIETNEIIDREMTDAEFAAYEAQKSMDTAKLAEEKVKANQKAELLEKLGITAEEADLLLA